MNHNFQAPFDVENRFFVTEVSQFADSMSILWCHAIHFEVQPASWTAAKQGGAFKPSPTFGFVIFWTWSSRDDVGGTPRTPRCLMSFCQSCADALHKNALGPRTVDFGALHHGMSEVNCWLGAGGS